MTLAQIKRTVQVGNVYDVTNHYLTRKDHPGYGTRRATVVAEAVNGRHFWLSQAGDPDRSGITWPEDAQVQQDADGVIRLYGGGAGQEPHELFLSLWPVKAADAAALAGALGTAHGAARFVEYLRDGDKGLMAALGETGPATAENTVRRSDLMDAYHEAYSWASGTCFECGDDGSDDVNGRLLCSACASEYDAEVAQADVEALDQIAGLLRDPAGATLGKIADVVRGTGRNAIDPPPAGFRPNEDLAALVAAVREVTGTEDSGDLGDAVAHLAEVLDSIEAEASDPYRPAAASFRLAEDLAAAWLERGARQADDGPPEGHDPDDSLPDIGGDWNPVDDEDHDRAIRDLLFAAQAAGLLTCPAGWTLGYEYGDVNGDGFRWMLASTDADRPLTLADAFNYTFPEGSGAVVAHRLLCQAVLAGNELLGVLDRYAAESKRPAPPAEVWVLEHEHRHGTEFTAHATEAGANAAAAGIARDHWDNVACLDGVPATPDGLGDEEAADIYFDNRPDEACHRHSLDVEGAEDQDDDDPAAQVVLCDECWEAATGLLAECEDGCNQDLDHAGLCVPGSRPAVPWVEMRDEGQFWLMWDAAMKGPYPSADAALADHYHCERCGDDTSRLHLLDAAEADLGDAHSTAP